MSAVNDEGDGEFADMLFNKNVSAYNGTAAWRGSLTLQIFTFGSWNTGTAVSSIGSTGVRFQFTPGGTDSTAPWRLTAAPPPIGVPQSGTVN